MLESPRDTKAGAELAMLPGFRFLFAATFLTMSILVFGLGAAALLRAAHEQFATNPAWHSAPEATFAQQVEAPRPVLAMLRVGGPVAEQKASGDASVAAIPAPAEPAAIAAPQPEPTAQPDAAKSDLPAAEAAVAAVPGDSPVSNETKPATPTSAGEVQVASTDQAAPEPASPPANQPIPPAAADAATSAPTAAAVSPEIDLVGAKIAALDTPIVVVAAKPLSTFIGPRPDPRVINKQLRARRAAHRRRMAARAARLARLAAEQLLQQQAADPFGLRFAQPASAPVAVAVAVAHSR
jgi:hypothetical protein